MDFANLDQLLKAIDVPSDIPVIQHSDPSIIKTTTIKPKTKFLFVGTHSHQFTGYSKVSYNLMKELSKHNATKPALAMLSEFFV